MGVLVRFGGGVSASVAPLPYLSVSFPQPSSLQTLSFRNLHECFASPHSRLVTESLALSPPWRVGEADNHKSLLLRTEDAPVTQEVLGQRPNTAHVYLLPSPSKS